jgi:hypothetical protein
MPIGRLLAAYPTLPFLATSFLESVTPARTPTPVLLTAGVLALLAGAMFVSFRRIGMPPVVGPLMVLLIVLHPAVLRAAIAGPAEMIFTVFLFLLGGALFDLRIRSAVPEVMAVALSLLGLAFSHPMGAAMACAAVMRQVDAARQCRVEEQRAGLSLKRRAVDRNVMRSFHHAGRCSDCRHMAATSPVIDQDQRLAKSRRICAELRIGPQGDVIPSACGATMAVRGKE